MIRAKTNYIVIHCSATRPNLDIGVAEIRQWHRDQGWTDIGYHYVIRRSGIVETGRPWADVGAHVQGYNAVSVGVCLAGGVNASGSPEDNFTPEQWRSLKELVLKLKTKYPEAHVQGHRDFPNVKKACPSFNVSTWLRKENI